MIQILLLLFSLTSFSTSDMKCEATFDKLGIPHQKVTDQDQFYFCFGFHHGRDRAWEMDYFRRVGQGRNAEIYGFSSLKSDLMMKLLNLPELAEKLYNGLGTEEKSALIKYAEGVNQGFLTGREAPEFKDKNYLPESWEPQHSMLVLLLQSFDQTRKTFFRDYEDEKAKEVWKEKANYLFDEDGVPWMNTILKDGEYPKKNSEKKVSNHKFKIPSLWSKFPTVFGEESGSNNWAVSKAKSKSGYAILANDPHLDLKTPLFWYWIHLETADDKVIGASVPGVPVVVSGTNGKVAWGLTNAYINTADSVFLKDIPEGFLQSFRPTVKVKFGFLNLPFFFKSFEKTQDGWPILPLETESEEKIALVWAGFFLKAEDLAPMFSLYKMKNVTEMDSTLKKVGLPAWNFVFADTKGDIGYRVVGNPFKHTEKLPLGITSKKATELKQVEFLTPEERPHVLKPKRNYVYTANNRHWPSDATFNGGRAYSYSFRGFRIDELLKENKHDLASFTNIQCDRQAVDARFFVPLITKHLKVSEFDGWDYSTEGHLISVALYRRFMDLLLEEWKVNEYALYRLLSEKDVKRSEEMNKLLKRARGEVNGRSWGDFHRLTFAHLSKNGDWKFSPELPGLGDNHSVDPGSARWDEEKKRYEQYSGASMRMIIELKDRPEIHLSLPGHNREYHRNQDFSPWDTWSRCLYNQVQTEI